MINFQDFRNQPRCTGEVDARSQHSWIWPLTSVVINHHMGKQQTPGMKNNIIYNYSQACVSSHLY